MSFHRLVMSSALAGSLACMAPAAQARDAAPIAAASLAVDSVDVEQVEALTSGVPLNFTVFGTPRSLAALRIDGARRVLDLRETDPGVYEGTYVIDARDAIRADSRVTASLQRGGDVAYSMLDEPLLLATGTLPWSPAANARARLLSAPAPVPNVTSIAIATKAGPTATPTKPTPMSAAPMPMPMPIMVSPLRTAPPAAALPAAPSPHEPAPCADCAVVESVHAVEAAPRGGVVGAIGGAIAGAILGKEAGEAHNRRVLSVLGAIGGALVGREVERQTTRSTQYDVVLRLADGTVLKRRYEEAPPFAAGETIRLGASAGRRARVPASL